MSSPSKCITVKSNSEEILIPLEDEDKLNIECLRAFFPNATVLIYDNPNLPARGLPYRSGYIYIDKNVDNYRVRVFQGIIHNFYLLYMNLFQINISLLNYFKFFFFYNSFCTYSCYWYKVT